MTPTDLKSLVLKHFFDRDIILGPGRACEPCLEYDTKRAISDDFAVGVGDLFLFARPITGDYFDDLVWVVDGYRDISEEMIGRLPSGRSASGRREETK